MLVGGVASVNGADALPTEERHVDGTFLDKRLNPKMRLWKNNEIGE
jgi:hypothetical protein